MAHETPPPGSVPDTEPETETPAEAPSTSHHKRHRGLVWTLIILAALIGFVGTLTTWVNRQMLDNKSWTNSSARILEDPQIRSALSVYLVNQLYDNVDLQAELQQALPPRLAPLAGPIAAGLRGPAAQGVDQLLARPRVQALWVKANQVAHQKFVNVVENKTIPGVSTANGNVTLDVSALVKELGQELGLPAAALDRIPPGTGQITILRSDQLSSVQKAVRLVKALSVWLTLIIFVLWGLALYFAAGARRVALRNIGWSIAIVGALLLVVRHSLGNYVVKALTKDPARIAGHHIWLITTGILHEIGVAAIAYGLIVVAGAILAGPTRVGTTIRGWIAPVLNEQPLLAWGIVAFVYLLLVVWGPTHALRTPFGILLLGALVAGGVYALRRETLAEFPA
jgi:hypothetical protein